MPTSNGPLVCIENISLVNEQGGVSATATTGVPVLVQNGSNPVVNATPAVINAAIGVPAKNPEDVVAF